MTFAIERRPFAVEPLTGIMLPDGIFEASLPQQRIACYLTNTAPGPVDSVTIWIKAVSDTGITVSQESRTFANVAGGASVLVDWTASFVSASPGKVTVTFAYMYSVTIMVTIGNSTGPSVAHAGSWVNPLEITKQIFVTHTAYDPASKAYACSVPEGRLTVKLTAVTGPKTLRRWNKPEYARKHAFMGPLLVNGADVILEAAQPFEGVHGDLPFQDPWWKVIAWVVFVVALVAAIIAAATGHGTAYIGLKGEDIIDHQTNRPACFNCTVDTWGGPEQFTAAGVLSIIAMLALCVGLSDDEDPWHRGQAATPPAAGEKTKTEEVSLKLDYPEPLEAGRPFPVQVKWEYRRRTNQRTLMHRVEEIQRNTHLVGRATIKVSRRTVKPAQPVTLTARFTRPDRSHYAGQELYVYALVKGPSGRSTIVVLQDVLKEGAYSVQLTPAVLGAGWWLSAANVRGTWKAWVFAQDTNSAVPGTAPVEAATHVGGYMVYSPLVIAVDGTEPCPDSEDVTFEVE